MSYDAVVIGGGINGLVAASVLARGGQRVCLLEQSSQLGGMAAAGPAGSSRMAHALWNLSPVVRREIGMDRHKWPFPQTPLRTVTFAPDGNHVIIDGSTPRFADGSAHPEVDAYRGLMKQITEYGALLRLLAEGPPPGFDGPIASTSTIREMWRLARFGIGLKRMEKRAFRRFLQVLLSNAYDLILDDLKDGPLAGLLAADAVRGAAMGPRSPGTVFSLIYRMGHGGVASVPEGGMHSVVDAFEAAALKARVNIRRDTGVIRILREGDQIVGVETDQGEIVSAHKVLSSTGALRTAQLMGLDAFDIEATRRLRNIRARGTAAKINLTMHSPAEASGLTPIETPTRYVLAPSAEYVERAFNPSKYKAMSDAPVIEAIQLNDQTLSLIVQYAPLDLEGGWTGNAKSELLKRTLTALSPYMPGLEASITASEIIMPDQIEIETGAPGGHWHHAEMALDQLLTLRPANLMGRYAFGPKGLFLCGAGTHPGGDVMGLSGRNAARVALEVAT